MDVGQDRCREKILSDAYYDVITDYPLRALGESEYDLCAVNVEAGYNIVYINRNEVREMTEYFFQYKSVPKLYGLMQTEEFDPGSLIASGILRTQRAPLNLIGRGVVLCFIDTGIDYRSPAFMDAQGNSRILAIWDQTIQTGQAPAGMFYGTEYRREEIDRALRMENPYEMVPSVDTNGHGTRMAEVAAGSRLSGTVDYLGAAPEADIVVVKLKECKQYLRDFYLLPDDVPAYQETDIMLALRYADSFAVQFRRPVVICLGVGTNSGDHAGNSALGRYLDVLARKKSRGIVVCGGNEGNAAHHFRGSMEETRGGVSAEGRVSVEVRVGENAKGFLMELWGNVPNVYTMSVRSPGGETTPPIRLGNQEGITYSFVYERTRISVAGVLVESMSGQELLVLRVQDPTPGVWNFVVEEVGENEAGGGEFHMWLPITQFLNTPVYFLEPEPEVTLTEPAMAEEVIAVSTYDAMNDSFYINSGRGFARNGRVKPDFSSPGVDIPTLRGKSTGSSLAAAVTAGAVAQFMQWAVVEGNDRGVATREVKNYLVRGAERNFDIRYPNPQWGYGRLDMVGTFDALIDV